MVEQVMTDIEAIVVEWLQRHKIKFQFQTSLLGGYFALGGAVVDILLEEGNIAIRIMGEYYHRGIEPEGKAVIQREMLEAEGWTVVDIWGEDIENPVRLEQAMRLALQGQEMLY